MTTPDRPNATLEDLQPLYQAVAHGCQAGLQQETCDKLYYARIARENEAYAVKKLGAFGSDLGAVACFFESPWSRVSPALAETDQAWLLNQAAFRLRALCRLPEALELMRVSGEMDVKMEAWSGAARSYNNLSELELTLGELAKAVESAEQSVSYANRSDDTFMHTTKRTTQAEALCQMGHRTEAELLFREAEALLTDNKPPHHLLHSLRGFQYCDLLMTNVEQEAAKAELGLPSNRRQGAQWVFS